MTKKNLGTADLDIRFVYLQLVLVSDCEVSNDPLYQNIKESHSSSEEELDDLSIPRSLFPIEPSTSKEINTISVKKGRKRICDEGKWKQNTAKRLRNLGKGYESYSGTKVNPRQMKPPCTEKCKLKCFAKITEEDRQQIFLAYWELGDLQKQRYFIASCLQTVQPKYRYVREDSHRSLNNAFYFNLREKKMRVCKIFFKNTLDISDRPISTVITKRKKFANNLLEEDRRGKHSNHSRKQVYSD